MRTHKKGFVSFAKEHAATAAAIASFVALFLSTAKSISSDLSFSVIVLLGIATLVLAAYNIWLIRKKQLSKHGLAKHNLLLTSGYRWTVHSASVLILALCWTVLGVLASDKYAGYLLLAIGHPEKAAVRLRSYILTKNDDIDACIRLSGTYKQLGQYSAYFDTLEEVLNNGKAFGHLDPATRNVRFGEISFDLGTSLIVDEFTEGLPSQPQKERALFHLKNARLYLGDNPVLLFMLGYVEAEIGAKQVDTIGQVKDLFSTAKAKIDSNPDTNNKSMLLMYHKWFGKALMVLKLYDEAEAELLSALDLAPAKTKSLDIERDRILLDLGLNEYDRSDTATAANMYWQQISDEKILRESFRLNGIALWSQGVQASNANQPKEAAALYKRAEAFLAHALRMGEQSPKLYLTLGIVYLGLEDYDQAAATFQNLTRMWPSQKLGYYWLGRSKLFIKGGAEEADKAMSKAVDLDPADGAAHYWLGCVAYLRKDYERARAELYRSLDLKYYDDNLHIKLVGVLVSLADGKLTYSDEYIALYEEALQRANEGIEATKSNKAIDAANKLDQLGTMLTNNLAYAYAQRTKNLSLALNYINRSLAKNPDEPLRLDTKAWILILKAERSTDAAGKEAGLLEAESLLTHALPLIPAEEKTARAEGLFHLGYLCKLRHEPEKAQNLFLQALDLNPAYAEAKAELQ